MFNGWRELINPNSMKKTAVYPGSFDPITNGHLDIIERAVSIFDKLIIAVLENPRKSSLFSVEERIAMIRDAVSEKKLPVQIDSFSGLLIDYLKKKKARVIIRGLRAVSDFEYEFQLALMNRNLDGNIETVFLMTDEVNSYLSSNIVKEVAALGGDISKFVTPLVKEELYRKSGR